MKNGGDGDHLPPFSMRLTALNQAMVSRLAWGAIKTSKAKMGAVMANSRDCHARTRIRGHEPAALAEHENGIAIAPGEAGRRRVPPWQPAMG